MIIGTLASLALDISLTDALLLTAVLGAGIKVLADQRGWTRSTTLVRQENADLRERNATLTAEVARLDVADREKGKQIAALEARIADLQERDQAAVLAAISAHDKAMGEIGAALSALHISHEKNAQTRREQQRGEHIEAMRVWNEIRDLAARGGTAG